MQHLTFFWTRPGMVWAETPMIGRAERAVRHCWKMLLRYLDACWHFFLQTRRWAMNKNGLTKPCKCCGEPFCWAVGHAWHSETVHRPSLCSVRWDVKEWGEPDSVWVSEALRQPAVSNKHWVAYICWRHVWQWSEPIWLSCGLSLSSVIKEYAFEVGMVQRFDHVSTGNGEEVKMEEYVSFDQQKKVHSGDISAVVLCTKVSKKEELVKLKQHINTRANVDKVSTDQFRGEIRRSSKDRKCTFWSRFSKKQPQIHMGLSQFEKGWWALPLTNSGTSKQKASRNWLNFK